MTFVDYVRQFLRKSEYGVLPIEKIAEYSGLEPEGVERLVKTGRL